MSAWYLCLLSCLPSSLTGKPCPPSRPASQLLPAFLALPAHLHCPQRHRANDVIRLHPRHLQTSGWAGEESNGGSSCGASACGINFRAPTAGRRCWVCSRAERLARQHCKLQLCHTAPVLPCSPAAVPYSISSSSGTWMTGIAMAFSRRCRRGTASEMASGHASRCPL